MRGLVYHEISFCEYAPRETNVMRRGEINTRRGSDMQRMEAGTYPRAFRAKRGCRVDSKTEAPLRSAPMAVPFIRNLDIDACFAAVEQHDLPRRTQRYVAKQDDDEPALVKRILGLAARHVRYDSMKQASQWVGLKWQNGH
jgi:hypothetical protein